jgi:hypothetical protein
MMVEKNQHSLEQAALGEIVTPPKLTAFLPRLQTQVLKCGPQCLRVGRCRPPWTASDIDSWLELVTEVEPLLDPGLRLS